MHSLRAGVIYFLLVFAVGWVLGPIREIWLIPRAGRMTATVVEAVIMSMAMIVSVRWVIRRYNVPPRLGPSILVGLAAFGILLPVEIAGALWVRRLAFDEYMESFVTGPGVISLAMFLLFAAMPALVARLERRH
jgi:hypothetical protein